MGSDDKPLSKQYISNTTGQKLVDVTKLLFGAFGLDSDFLTLQESNTDLSIFRKAAVLTEDVNDELQRSTEYINKK